MAIVPSNVLDPKTSAESKAVYLKSGGDDTNDGTTQATAIQTWPQAITLATGVAVIPRTTVVGRTSRK